MSQFEGEKYEYCLQVYGPMFDNPAVTGEGLKAGKHFFGTIAELWYFFAELQISAHNLKAPPPYFTVKEGRNVRYQTVATILYMHDFITYQVEVKTEYITDHQQLRQRIQAPDCGFGCDCTRSHLIRVKVPDFPSLGHGNTIELLTVKIEDRK